MKRMILTILCLLLAAPCLAQEQLAWMGAVGVGGGGGQASACASGTKDQEYVTTANATPLTTAVAGQSFQVSKIGYLYSIKIRVPAFTTTSDATFTLRWGKNLNLTDDSWDTGYADEVTYVVDADDDWAGGLVEFVIKNTTNALATGTTYYFMVKQAGSSGAVIWYTHVGSGAYAGGVSYSTTGTDWNLTDHHDSTNDKAFEVDLCN